jgi:hypothetical protein
VLLIVAVPTCLLLGTLVALYRLTSEPSGADGPPQVTRRSILLAWAGALATGLLLYWLGQPIYSSALSQ